MMALYEISVLLLILIVSILLTEVYSFFMSRLISLA